MPNEFTIGPVNLWIKCAELGVTKDQSVASKVCDVESFCNFLISSGYKEVKVVGDASSFIIWAINVSELDWFWQFLTFKFQLGYCFLVNEVFCGTTINKCFFFYYATEQM